MMAGIAETVASHAQGGSRVRKRKTVSSGSMWEELVGYSRAVRIGDSVEVAGTVAADEDGNVVGAEDAYEQARYALEKAIAAALQAGAQREDVIRSRIYVTDFNNYQAVARAHKELLGDIKPASTMLQVSALVSAEYLVEVELSAVVRQPPAETYLV